MRNVFSATKGWQIIRLISYIFIFLAAELLVTYLLFKFIWKDKFYPGIKIAGISVANLSYDHGFDLISFYSKAYIQKPIVLTDQEKQWVVNPNEIGLKYDLPGSLEKAFLYGRRFSVSDVLSLTKLLRDGVNFDLKYELSGEVFEASMSAIASETETPAIPPSISVNGEKIEINEGEPGRSLDKELALKTINHRLSNFSSRPIPLNIQTVNPSFNLVDIDFTKLRAEKMLKKTVMLSYKDEALAENPKWELSGEDLISFLAFDGGFDQEKIASYSASIAESVNRPAQNATFIYQDGRVEEFAPAKNGLKLAVNNVTNQLIDSLSNFEFTEEEELFIELEPEIILPEVTISDINTLGIKELLGRGSSTFHGSIANRKYNISLAASKISGYLVAPNSEFSFNTAVGDISAASGYRQSYIIKDGRTILGDGGGACQVSTTVFRAALDAGLLISERKAHSYRVSYYEQNSKPGYDATVYAPSVDLKFFNDTSAHLLIQTEVDTSKNSLVVEIYGSSDGRRSEISNYKMWDVVPPPPDLYQDDPTLPTGTNKQIDWKAWGAKVKYDYRVERGGNIIHEKTFYNNFQPWQSVFLRGTGI